MSWTRPTWDQFSIKTGGSGRAGATNLIVTRDVSGQWVWFQSSVTGTTQHSDLQRQSLNNQFNSAFETVDIEATLGYPFGEGSGVVLAKGQVDFLLSV
jgi:hypothetical protein